MSIRNLFSGVNFANTVRKYCADNGWNVADLSDDRAVLRFTMESGRRQTLFIIRYEATLEFSVPSEFTFDSEDEVPHRLSTILLRRSSESKIGFWCLEKIGGKYVYSCMHNAEIDLLDSHFFAKVVRRLTRECDDFEEMLHKMLST